jgi:short-subunit dehydrogenase
MRFEVKGFGVDVILIQPGLITSGFSEVTAREIGAATTPDGPYAEFNLAVGDASLGAYKKGPLAKLAGPPEAVAETIEKALAAKRPKARYKVTASARVLMGLNSVLPDSGWDKVLESSFPRPGKG